MLRHLICFPEKMVVDEGVVGKREVKKYATWHPTLLIVFAERERENGSEGSLYFDVCVGQFGGCYDRTNQEWEPVT